MQEWWRKYENLPYKHLGIDPINGIDCTNLASLVLKREKGVDVGFTSGDHCSIDSEKWYNSTLKDLMLEYFKNNKDKWVEIPKDRSQPFDIALISLGSTNITNHCAIFVEKDKLLHIMLNKKSWVSSYGRYWKQYTIRIFRWKDLIN